MRLEIEIPEHHYNNIMALDSVSLGRVPYKGIIMYTINAIKHGKVLEQEPQSFKWCTDCKEYDQEKHCCHRWSKVIRDTVEEMKQEPEPKTGHWIKTPKAVMGEGYMWYCDKCEYQVYQDSSRDYPSEKYCPNCGCRMFEPQESEE